MKITETITRDCCLHQDLLPYKGKPIFYDKSKPYFCRHCGQIWVADRRMDAAGSMEEFRRPMEIFDLIT